MDSKLDIFQKLPDGAVLWVKVVETLDEARVQLEQLTVRCPGDYFIYNTRYGTIIKV